MTEATTQRYHERQGVLAGVAAFGMWGLMPIYFKVAGDVGALEMLVHRVIWGVPFGAMIILLRNQWREVGAAMANPKSLGMLALSSVFIAVNWLAYIWAVQTDEIFQASLGYYINPLLYVVAGFVLLGERLRRFQLAAVGLAAIGVTVLTVSGGQFPAISFTVAISFTIYGVIRKQIAAGAMPGLFVETILLCPLCIAYLGWLMWHGSAAFGTGGAGFTMLLFAAGPVTVLPLLLFSVAARRLRLATIGFLQFIAPTGQFLVGVYYGEQLTVPHIICFAFIWTAAAVFIYDAWKSSRAIAPVA